MIGKIVGIIGIVLLLALGVFLYQVVMHPAASGIPSSWFHGVASSSAFNFSLGSSHVAQGPSGLPAATGTYLASPSSTGAPAIDPSQIPAGYTLAELSPYFHQIRLGSVSAGTSYYYGQITLYAYLNSGEKVDITGWQIKTNNSGEYIPQAINLYDPSGLTPASDIVVKSGDTVSLYSSSAPFNLRLNACVGYLAHVANFKPGLPESCPYIDRSALQNFTGACQNYIGSLSGCASPDLNNVPVPRTDYACYDYLQNHFNYKSCFTDHVGDANFLSNQVWVWTGSNVVDQYHDTVKLLDRQGRLVDLYSY